MLRREEPGLLDATLFGTAHKMAWEEKRDPSKLIFSCGTNGATRAKVSVDAFTKLLQGVMASSFSTKVIKEPPVSGFLIVADPAATDDDLRKMDDAAPPRAPTNGDAGWSPEPGGDSGHGGGNQGAHPSRTGGRRADL